MADDPNPNPAPVPAPTPEPTPDPEPPAYQAPKSQAELDAIVEQRLSRERKKFADYDDLKSKAEKYDELEAEQKSELEREKEAREKAERDKDAAVETSRTTLKRAGIIAEAARQNAVDPEAVWALIDKAEIELDDAGNVTNAETVVKGLLTQRDYLVASNGGGRSGNGADQGARGGADEKLTLEAYKLLSPEEQRDAIRDGRVDLAAAGRS